MGILYDDWCYIMLNTRTERVPYYAFNEDTGKGDPTWSTDEFDVGSCVSTEEDLHFFQCLVRGDEYEGNMAQDVQEHRHNMWVFLNEHGLDDVLITPFVFQEEISNRQPLYTHAFRFNDLA